MFSSNWYCTFKKKSNKIQPVKNIQVWENKKVIHEVFFDDLQEKSDYTNNHKIKKNISTIYNGSS